MALQKVLKNVATKLIAKFGRDVTHVAITEGKYNPDTSTSEVRTEQTIKALFSNYKARDYNNNIKIGDAPMTTVSEVKVDDKIVSNGIEYRITQSEAIPIEDGNVMYQCNLRALV